MKIIVLTVLAALSTACSLTPERMATYHPQPGKWIEYHGQSSSVAQQPLTQLKSNTVSAYPSAQTIVTTSGNYVIIPNYSTGGVSAVLGPR